MDWEREDKTRRVLKALIQCSKSPEFKEDCGDCPYLDVEGGCIGRLCHDAYSIITHQGKLLQQMTDPNTVMIDKTAKPVQGILYCKAHQQCHSANHKCPYNDQTHCLSHAVEDLLNLIEGGDVP